MAAPALSTWRFAQGSAIVELTAPDTYRVVPSGARRAERSHDPTHAQHSHSEQYPHNPQHPQPTEHVLRVLAREPDSLRTDCDGTVHRVRVVDTHERLHLFHDGRHVQLKPLRTEDALQATGGTEQGSLLTPLPGTIVAVHVSMGQQVTRGAALMTVEAMKMEHTLTAPYDGAVSRIAFGLGDRVQAGAVLVELSPTTV
jgi:acetyl/propionyl-CoA carboxylase alpha subunit